MNIALQPAAGDRPIQGSRPWGKISRLIFLALTCGLIILSVGLNASFLAGYRLIPTRGDSMEPAISAGSVLLVRPTAPEQVRVGDVIVFSEPTEGSVYIAHRVVVLANYGRRLAALTKGDNNPVPDPAPLALERTLPRVVLVIPYVGWLFTPALGWQLLAISSLLWLGVYLRWRARRGAGARTSLSH